MANPSAVLWVDFLGNRLVAGWQKNLPASKPTFKQGDETPIIIRKVECATAPYGIMEEFPFGNGVTVTVGNRNLKPYAGFFTLSFEDSTTDYIKYNASADEVQDTLNSMPDIAIAGGVRVTQLYGDAYKVSFNNQGLRSPLTGNGLLLMPQSVVNVTTVKQGSLTEQATFILLLRQDDYSESVTWDTEPACTASASQVNAYTWQFGLSKQPKGGGFELIINDLPALLVPVNASVEELQTLVGEDYTVQSWGNWNWRIISNDLSAFDITVDGEQVVSFQGVEGVLPFTSPNITEALSASQTIDAFLEITEEDGSDERVLLNRPCTILSKVNR